MLELKHVSLKRELDLTLYPLTKKKSRVKSTFIDHNRPDTVRPTQRDLISNEDTKGKQLTKKINNEK